MESEDGIRWDKSISKGHLEVSAIMTPILKGCYKPKCSKWAPSEDTLK